MLVIYRRNRALPLTSRFFAASNFGNVFSLHFAVSSTGERCDRDKIPFARFGDDTFSGILSKCQGVFRSIIPEMGGTKYSTIKLCRHLESISSESDENRSFGPLTFGMEHLKNITKSTTEKRNELSKFLHKTEFESQNN